jgi:molybdate transport system permease protein
MTALGFTVAELDALTLSLVVSGWAVAASLPPGILAAFVLARLRFPGKNLLDGLIHLPLVVPPVVTGYLLLVVMGKGGVVGSFLHRHLGIVLAFNWKGAVLAAAVMSFPLLVRSVRLSLEGVDRNLEAAARTLGAGPVRIFFTVTLPLATPGVITGVILAFARSLGEFGATITFVSNIQGQTRTLPLALYTLTQVPGGEAGAMRLCLLSVAISMAALVGSEVMARRFAARMAG